MIIMFHILADVYSGKEHLKLCSKLICRRTNPHVDRNVIDCGALEGSAEIVASGCIGRLYEVGCFCRRFAYLRDE